MRIVCDKKGFSLIETLVVCIIIGILAAVSIPLYIGYVNNSRQNTVTNLAETAATAANVYFRRTATALSNADILPQTAPLDLYFNNTTYRVKVVGDSINVSTRTGTSFTATRGYK